jgi:ribosome-binding protein aMBF1 (putative translation factor)
LLANAVIIPLSVLLKTTPYEGETVCVQSPVHEAIYVSFPKQLKAIREERGLSLEEMAENIGLEVTELRRYESGYTHPTLSAVKEIAAALGIGVLTLIGR